MTYPFMWWDRPMTDNELEAQMEKDWIACKKVEEDKKMSREKVDREFEELKKRNISTDEKIRKQCDEDMGIRLRQRERELGIVNKGEAEKIMGVNKKVLDDLIQQERKRDREMEINKESYTQKEAIGMNDGERAEKYIKDNDIKAEDRNYNENGDNPKNTHIGELSVGLTLKGYDDFMDKLNKIGEKLEALAKQMKDMGLSE